MPVLSKIHPVKGCDFAKRRRFPARSPPGYSYFPDFQRNTTQEGGYQELVLDVRDNEVAKVLKPLLPPVFEKSILSSN